MHMIDVSLSLTSHCTSSLSSGLTGCHNADSHACRSGKTLYLYVA